MFHTLNANLTIKFPGILKNPSYELGSSVSPPRYAPHAGLATPSLDSPENKEITLQNTLQNAGPRRASSSSQVRRLSAARRQNSTDESNQRLKWDEANLYLTEQDRTSTMKITEPKTPYAPHYDPAQDEAEQLAEEAKEAADSGDIVVDELDGKVKGKALDRTQTDEIPGLELGEPEEAISGGFDLDERDRIIRERSSSNGSAKHVDVAAVDGHDGEDMSEKHKEFEKKRKMHYEMGNVANLLG